MKIAFVEPHLELYGGIRRIMELSNRLIQLGEDVSIYHPSGAPCTWMEGRAPTRPTRALFESEFDAIIFNNPPDYRIARKATARLKVFYILCLYEREKLKEFSPKIFWPRKGRMMSLKRALQMPFLRLANATWMQRYLIDELQMESLLLIGGVNRDIFRPVDVQRDPKRFRILWSGDPRKRKGADTVLPAFELVARTHQNVELDTYHGKNLPQSRMAEAYCSADLFVDAQWYAGWNNPVAEAMACGVPVVCTDIGGVADFAVQEETALLVKTGAVGEMASAINRMIEDEPLRTRLKLNAINKITKFDWDRSARDLQKLLQTRL